MSKVTTLGEIADIITGPFGSQLHMSDYVDVGIPVIMPQDIIDGTVSMDSIAYIKESDYQRLIRYAVKNNDIIFARRGDIEKHAFITDDSKMLCGTGCFRVRITDSKVYPLFLSYFLDRLETRKWLVTHAVGTNMPNLNTTILSSVPVKLPDYEEQVKIGDFLYNIEKKIQCNKKINDNLQHQLKLLYDYWFTQFDFPDENGKPYRASGGAMVWCDELQREIPKGWKVSTLSDIAVLQAKSVMPQAGTAYNHYSIPAFDDTHSPAVEDGEAIASNKYVVPDNSVLVSKLNPQFKRIWLIIDSTDNAICSTEFLPVKATETGVYALYSLLNSDAFSVHLIQNASSSTGSRKRIDPDNCMSYKFPYDQKVFARFDKAIQPLLMKITGIPTETQALVALRDWLLPMLMNGQATISD